MGTGKTVVGREIAERLSRPFVDMDTLIEARTGRSISNIFEHEGEAYFRQLETDVCRELSAQHNLVISTGGWALGSRENRALMARTGLIVCLTAAAPELVRRLNGQSHRPLLATEDWQSKIDQLLARREPVYRQISLLVNTTRLSRQEVANRVLQLWQAFHKSGPPQVLPVSTPDGGYQVLIDHQLLDRIGTLVRALGPTGPIVIVTDDNVNPLYGQRVANALSHNADRPPILQIHAGEVHKTLDTVRRLYNAFLEHELDRSGIVIALGGGVAGDVAGFAAATFMRGVRLVQVPTTLLAMVDSSIGGKTGVDLPQGKNLVGAFKQPELVVIDPDTLDTLPPVELQSGMAEVIKHGIIGDEALFRDMEALQPAAPPANTDISPLLLALKHSDSSLVDLITRAIAVKQRVVESDPFEQGRRAILNLGHTFGHALEQDSNYNLRHGQGVAIGLVAAAHTAFKMDLCDADLARRITNLLQKMGLPTTYQGGKPQELWAAMATDKKRRGKRLRFILPEAIGQVIITDRVPQKLVLQVLRELQQ
jgi:3-dehydroquinate synthase